MYAEVETRIEALRRLLLDKLLQTPSTLHDQKRYIRYEHSQPVAQKKTTYCYYGTIIVSECQQTIRSYAQSVIIDGGLLSSQRRN